MLRQLKAVFAPVPLGEAELMADPQTTWTRLLGDIAEARREVLIENYILLDGDAADALLSALAAAAERGARIRVTIDGAGSYQLSARLRRRLDEVGELRIYHPLRFGALFGGLHTRLLRRTHRRLVVIDGTIGWTGGIAVEDPWWPAPGRVAVRDTMARVTGEPAAQLQAAFDQLWREELPALQEVDFPRAGEVCVVPHYARGRNRFGRMLRAAVNRAERRVWIGTAYFIPPRALRRLLYRSIERGIDVRLMLPGPVGHDHPMVRTASHRYYGRLLAKGVRIFEYQPSFYHAKCCLVDHRQVLVGSGNLDSWSYMFNHEIGVFLDDADAAAELERQFDEDFAASREITLDAWRERPLRDRIAERFTGLFDRWF